MDFNLYKKTKNFKNHHHHHHHHHHHPFNKYNLKKSYLHYNKKSNQNYHNNKITNHNEFDSYYYYDDDDLISPTVEGSSNSSALISSLITINPDSSSINSGGSFDVNVDVDEKKQLKNLILLSSNNETDEWNWKTLFVDSNQLNNNDTTKLIKSSNVNNNTSFKSISNSNRIKKSTATLSASTLAFTMTAKKNKKQHNKVSPIFSYFIFILKNFVLFL